jgi:hypothetical protein
LSIHDGEQPARQVWVEGASCPADPEEVFQEVRDIEIGTAGFSWI